MSTSNLALTPKPSQASGARVFLTDYGPLHTGFDFWVALVEHHYVLGSFIFNALFRHNLTGNYRAPA